MIDYIYDYYKLYLARDNTFVKKYVLDTKDKVYEVIDTLKNEYDEYLIIGHINLLNQDEVVEHQQIEHTYTKKKKR